MEGQGDFSPLSQSRGAIPLLKASEPQGPRVFAAYHSLSLTRPSRLLNPAMGLQPVFSPRRVQTVPSSPCLAVSGSFTTLLALIRQERREGAVFLRVVGGMNLGGGGH